MGALLKAFKTARDNNCQTGAAVCVVPFMVQMEDLFGDRPMMSSSHTIGISRGKHTSQTKSPPHLSRSPVAQIDLRNHKSKSPDSHSPLFTETFSSNSSHSQQCILLPPSVSTAMEPASPCVVHTSKELPATAGQPISPKLNPASQGRRPVASTSKPRFYIPTQASQASRAEINPSSPLSSQNTALLRRRKTIKEQLFFKELDSREKIAAIREEGRNKRFKDKMELLIKLEDSKTKRAATESKERAEMFAAAQCAQEQLYKALHNQNK